MIKKTSVVLFFIFCALLTQSSAWAQESSDWESDPLDVLESKPGAEPAEPPSPEFQDIPDSTDAASTSKDSTPGTENSSDDLTLDDVPPPEILNTESTPAPSATPVSPAIEPPAPEQVDIPTPEPMTPAPLRPESTVSADPVYGSEADFNREAEFHRIYKTYNEQPTSVEAWEQAVGSRDSQRYSVQKGDTLSDISQTLFNDPFYWPKIWSLNNDKITNPHEISPGLNINFFPGSALDAPTLAVMAENATDKNSTTDMKPPLPSMAGAVIPPAKKRTPLLQNLPASLPGYAVGGAGRGHEDMIVDLKASKFPEAKEDLEFYISESKLPSAGTVTAVELGVNSAGNFQQIYVEIKGTAEKKYVVQAYRPRLKNPRWGRDVEMIEVQGEIEILEKVNENRNIYRAMIHKTLHPVVVGSFLTPGVLSQIDPKITTLTTGVKASIIGGAYDNNRKLMSLNSYVFLDRGTSQGISEGQSIAIFANEDLRNNSKARINDRMIGVVKIVRVTSGFATGYVVRADEDIQTGDYVGGRPVFETDAVGDSGYAPGEGIDLDGGDSTIDEPPPKADPGSEDLDLSL